MINVLVPHRECCGGKVMAGFSFFATVVLPPCRKCEILNVL